uniref:Uncharacterized protein n=1 Tax=Octopus bimaculoides TaxID=37653 RepID=A0A0L8GAF6_OCTBM
MMCGCHLPAVVNFMKKTYNRDVNVLGKCHIDLGNNQSKEIGILEYSQCGDYSLFQRNLQCQTCSGMMCNDSEVTSCSNIEPVCRYMISMKGVSLKFERSCSTYRTCVEAERNNTFTCNKWRTNGTSCVACCTGNLCNKNDFVGWTNSFVFYVIYTKDAFATADNQNRKFNDYRNTAENISRAMEYEFSNMKGAFKVEYCGLERIAVTFTVYATALAEISKEQLWKNIYETLNTSQRLRNLGFQPRNTELSDITLPERLYIKKCQQTKI